MTDHFSELTEDKFDGRYPLVANHLNPAASWGYGDGPGCLVETYGDEFVFVRSQDPGRVWTLVDGGDGDLYLVSGLHFVDLVGYLLTSGPIPEGTSVEVRLPMSSDDEEEEP